MQENNTNIDNSNSNKEKLTKKSKYSLLTIVLLICILQLAISNVQNINKTIMFKGKIKGLENKRNEELAKNKDLKLEIENFNSDEILESIARNNLKMAGKDEILVIINDPNKDNDQDQDKKKKKDKKKKRDKKKEAQ